MEQLGINLREMWHITSAGLVTNTPNLGTKSSRTSSVPRICSMNRLEKLSNHAQSTWDLL